MLPIPPLVIKARQNENNNNNKWRFCELVRNDPYRVTLCQHVFI